MAIVDPVLKQRLEFSRSTDPDGGEVLHVHTWVDPGGFVSPHVHPAMEERFHVLAGRARFLAGRRWSEAGEGEVVVVAPGTRHAYRNDSDAVAELRCDARPPSSLEAFLTEIAELSRSGGLSGGALPKSPRALVRGGAIAHRHRAMVTLGFPMPPRPVQRALFP